MKKNNVKKKSLITSHLALHVTHLPKFYETVTKLKIY